MLIVTRYCRFGLLVVLLGLVSQTTLAKELPVMVGIGGAFEAVDTQSRVFTEENLKGKIALLAFGYTNCADVCPVTVGYMRNVYAKLTPEEQGQVQFVFVTVDPETDTPKFLKEYLAFFNKDFIGLTGTRAQVDVLIDNYKVDYQRLADGGVPADMIRRIDKIGKADMGGHQVKQTRSNPYMPVPDWESKTVAELHATGGLGAHSTTDQAKDQAKGQAVPSDHDIGSTASMPAEQGDVHIMPTDHSKMGHDTATTAADSNDGQSGHEGHQMPVEQALYSHSAHLFVLDRDAQARALAHTGTPQLDLVANIRSLIGE